MKVANLLSAACLLAAASGSAFAAGHGENARHSRLAMTSKSSAAKCEVAGNTESKTYWIKGDKDYVAKHALAMNGKDHFKCFASVDDASKEGFKSANAP